MILSISVKSNKNVNVGAEPISFTVVENLDDKLVIKVT